MNKKKTIEIEIGKLERIAAYYNIPFAIFLGSELKGTRNNVLLKKLMKVKKKMQKIVEEL